MIGRHESSETLNDRTSNIVSTKIESKIRKTTKASKKVSPPAVLLFGPSEEMWRAHFLFFLWWRWKLSEVQIGLPILECYCVLDANLPLPGPPNVIPLWPAPLHGYVGGTEAETQ